MIAAIVVESLLAATSDREQMQNLEPTNRLFYVCSRRLLTYLSCLAISYPANSCLV